VRVMLMLSDREQISRGLAEGLAYKEIGLRLGRRASVISREVARGGSQYKYGGRGGEAKHRGGVHSM
jgi:IS30 family transposase